jgi:hypothetical protein
MTLEVCCGNLESVHAAVRDILAAIGTLTEIF